MTVNRVAIDAKIIEIVQDDFAFALKELAVTPQTRFVAELGMDSLDLVELVMAVETEFNIELDNASALESVTTVSGLADLVEQAIRATPTRSYPVTNPWESEVERIAAFGNALRVEAATSTSAEVVQLLTAQWKRALKAPRPQTLSTESLLQDIEDLMEVLATIKSHLGGANEVFEGYLHDLRKLKPLVPFDSLSLDVQMDWVGVVRHHYTDIGPKEANRLAAQAYAENDGLLPVLESKSEVQANG
jgi:acyl carrier protein